MKRIILIAFLSFLAFSGYAQNAQKNMIWGLYGGAGASTVYNYDVGVNGGFDFIKDIGYKTWLGATLFYQGYAFLYDREDHYVNNGGGNAGVTILNKSSYIFIAPEIAHDFGKKGFLKGYINAGVGFKMSGTETMRKWDYSYGNSFVPASANYDSLINTSNNINSMVLRMGVGLVEYLHLNNHWWFTIREDCGFLGSTLSKTSNADDPSRTQYSPNGKLNPNYFSLQIGISHTKL